MTLKDFEKDGGYEYDECWYESAEVMLQAGVLGFCGCGMPGDNLVFVLEGLLLMTEDKPVDVEHGVWWADLEARRLAHFGSAASALFFAYWANEKFGKRPELMEHGGSVYGSWLTEHGKQAIALIREWKESNECQKI